MKQEGSKNLTLILLCSLDEWLSHDSEATGIYLSVQQQHQEERQGYGRTSVSSYSQHLPWLVIAQD